MPKSSTDEIEAIVNAQTQELNQLRGDLGVMMEQVNKLVGKLSPSKTPRADPPAYSPASSPTTDPVQLLQLMIAAEERGSRRTMEMFERVGSVMGNMQESLIKGMDLANKQRETHFKEFEELGERFAPEEPDPGENALDGLGEAFRFAEEIKARIKGGNGSAGAPVPAVPEGQS